MDVVIREGRLRLQTSEASCDVILSCQGRRLMAHQIILSIASPILRDLLVENVQEPAVLIFPDIASNTMSLILDYIYTGSVVLYSNTIRDFLDVAKLLKINVEAEKFEQEFKYGLFSPTTVIDKKESEVYSRRNQKRMPELRQIDRTNSKLDRIGGAGSCFVQSPWKPRMVPMLSDPRTYLTTTIKKNEEKTGEDLNNNSPSEQTRLPRDLSIDANDNMQIDLSSNGPQKIYEKTHHGNPSKSEEDLKHRPFKCEECGKCFSQLRNYKYHRSMHKGTREFAAECHECGKQFNDRGYLSSHMKIHRDKKEYACSHCPKRFNQRVAYNMHLRIHTGLKPHQCPTCSKSFSRKMLLKQHQRVHTGERPYSCPECGKTFADRSNMSLHARLHTGVKPYACTLCPKSFTKKHHLKTHMNFHTGLKPYTCEKCGLAFSQSSNMRTHYKKCVQKSTAAENTDSNSSFNADTA